VSCIGINGIPDADYSGLRIQTAGDRGTARKIRDGFASLALWAIALSDDNEVLNVAGKRWTSRLYRVVGNSEAPAGERIIVSEQRIPELNGLRGIAVVIMDVIHMQKRGGRPLRLVKPRDVF